MSALVINSNSGADMNRIVELAKKLDMDMMTITPEEIEEIEDQRLLQRMEKSLASGLADREEMYKLLGHQK